VCVCVCACECRVSQYRPFNFIFNSYDINMYTIFYIYTLYRVRCAHIESETKYEREDSATAASSAAAAAAGECMRYVLSITIT